MPSFLGGSLFGWVISYYFNNAQEHKNNLIKRVEIIRDEAIQFYQIDASSYQYIDRELAANKIVREMQYLVDEERNFKRSIFFYSAQFKIPTKIKALREFYESKLFIVPSPYLPNAGFGLKFNYIENGIFDTGNTGQNKIEAKRVAEAVMKHAKEQPRLSLGVAAFSIKQAQAIRDELELLRRANPSLETYFNSHPHEPFFIKNLENVQGDERDVIYISVGYSRPSEEKQTFIADDGVLYFFAF